MKKITIIDYECGNILSIQRALEKIGFSCGVTNNKEKILSSDFLILPGVGAFKHAMSLLKKFDLINILEEYVLVKKKPILGICLGMQILFSKSYEMGEHNGLNFVSGEVIEIKKKTKMSKLKIPHISWNSVFLNKNINVSKKIDNILSNREYYFVHSFIGITKKSENTIAYCDYFDVKIPAVIKQNNILGCQFHPEKSGANGLNFLKNVIEDKI